MPVTPSASYSLTLRIELDNEPGDARRGHFRDRRGRRLDRRDRHRRRPRDDKLVRDITVDAREPGALGATSSRRSSADRGRRAAGRPRTAPSTCTRAARSRSATSTRSRPATTSRWPTRRASRGSAGRSTTTPSSPSATRSSATTWRWSPTAPPCSASATSARAAAMPVMEGKAMLLKEFGGVDAFPICLDTKDVDEIVATVKAIAPGFGGINLEDISSPRCFEVEDRLKEELDIPVFHDDQHGTAVVVMAALFNALKITGKRLEDLQVAMVGLGAAGIAVTRMLLQVGRRRDHRLRHPRRDLRRARRLGRDAPAEALVRREHEPRAPPGGPADVLEGADLFIGLSGPGRDRGRGPRPHERRRDGVRDGEPRARGDARGGRRARADRRHRPLRLPEPDQQRALLPRALPRRARRARDADHRGDEAGRRARDRRGDLPSRSCPRSTSSRACSTAASSRRSPRRSPTRRAAPGSSAASSTTGSSHAGRPAGRRDAEPARRLSATRRLARAAPRRTRGRRRRTR